MYAPLPSLVQLITDPTYPRALKGVRVMAKLRLENDGETPHKAAASCNLRRQGSPARRRSISPAPLQRQAGELYTLTFPATRTLSISCVHG